MRKILYTILAATAIFTGCNRELIEKQENGSLALELDCQLDYTDKVTKSSQTTEDIINNLRIEITRPADGWQRVYERYSEIKGKVIELGSGSYIITASSAEKKPAAFEQPIFEGSASFTIQTGEVTTIDLTCKITNLMVSVVLTENFVKELSDYTVTVTNGQGSLSWTKTSEVDDFELLDSNGQKVYRGKRAGYFFVAPLTITVDGHRNLDGTVASTKYYVTSPSAADHHIINIDANVIGSIGGINLSISDEVNPIDQTIIVPGIDENPVPGDEPTPEEPTPGEGGDNGDDSGDDTGEDEQPSTAPELLWPSNQNFAPMDLPMTKDASVDVELTVNAPEGIKSFIIYVNSAVLSPTVHALTAAGEAGESMKDNIAVMDMINDATLCTNLAGMGLGIPVADQIKDQTSVPFSLSGLIPFINWYVTNIVPYSQHIFTLNVEDHKGQTLEQTITFVSVPVE